ncbi:peptidoglycan DD-metalloendopeptidase family protein [Bacillus bingmayongensis]|uniref:peptidoglycan DD-metalloendopeptidase family protein n=1 Tax=Bacillus bingmayongensis TaxID=1150157 RepID=UPI001C8ECCFA|nr:peptidoglycan DD-metalloendopeptidase family protein [Bacillus bingmayongensis]MBY0595840.1 peptidoglycan DD-metalloendopeptidase family protein [Bacillus bingmayongensis]
MKKQIAALTLATTLGLSIQPIVSSAETAQNIQETQQSGWVKEENGTWFFYENGAKKTGWLALEGKWYYLDPNAGGAMKTGWAQVNGTWYYLNANDGGAMKIGWEKVDGKWYYLDGNNGGAMKTGWLQENGKWYYLNANDGGAMKTGWEKVDGKWYYLDGNDGGAMKTGWFQENGKWYYLNANDGGAMKTGWEKVDGKWYYLDGNDGGAMKTGWFQEGSAWYYLDANKGGAMVTGQATIDGKTYVFADNGQWLENAGEVSAYGYQMPIKNPNVSSGYGPRWDESHKGIDFAAKTGTPIMAAKSGTVEFSGFGSPGSFNDYGNVVVIKHADGYYTLYAHMSERIAQKGDYVQQGQVIGKVGATGRVTGPHLHFELKTEYKFGQINPTPYLPFK